MEHTLLQWAHQLGTLEYWQTLLDRFGDLGPLAPITLAVGLWAAMYAVSKRFCKRHHLD